ncbi:unnamed protein product [Linum tenue]|uniref:HSF-type DNA-binding domain-containing protein n=1 Tax=Linum tenue TaxID=586396 RepID=A0AAV0P454_9ROSI|nr:unnamed protein product [Linum tenue]
MLENSSCGGGGGAGDQGLLLSLDSHKAVPAPFLTKTYQLVDDPSTDHVVSWGEDESTFVVWRPPEFARDLLPNYFKHNNFSSFVRQLNTYGFRKIVPDRWEFANDFFKKGEKHLLCEIHRRKTAHPPPPPPPHHHHHLMGAGAGFFPFSTNRISISPDDDDLHLFPNHHNHSHNHNYWDNPPPAPQSCSSPRTTTTTAAAGGSSNSGVGTTVTALAQDNERLRRSNNMLMSELAHMKKLYNDIIYFVQNHVKPVAPPSNHHSTSSFPPFPSNGVVSSHHHHHLAQKPLNQLLGYYPASNMQGGAAAQVQVLNNRNLTTATSTTSPSYSNSGNSQSTVTILEELPNNNGSMDNGSCNRTKLFGVPISKKRVHPDQYYGGATVENSKAHRLVLEKDDLGLNLMPPSAC